jgi:ankyrin repeat protein
LLKNHVPVDVHDEVYTFNEYLFYFLNVFFCFIQHGMTPLQHAAFKGHANICSILLAHGADVNDHEHDQGYTALMFGALSGKKKSLFFFKAIKL